MHVAWGSKEKPTILNRAKCLKMCTAQLHSKQSHELMLCTFFACLWCWSSHFNCTNLVLLLVNLVGRPLISSDCAKKLLQILKQLFRTMRHFCIFTVWWNPKCPHVERKQNEGCVALTLCSQGQEELPPIFHLLSFFLSSPKCQKETSNGAKRISGGTRGRSKGRMGAEGCTELK